MPEWWVFREVARRARPGDDGLIGLADAQSIRREIGAAIPLYHGIESLKQPGDQVQWGGRHFYADGRFATSDGKARFVRTSTVLQTAGPSGHFVLSTRRGKQFNSMVQRDVDPLTGASRHDILISAEDLQGLGIDEGSRVELDPRLARSLARCAWPLSSPAIFRCTGPKAMCCWVRAWIRIPWSPTTTPAWSSK